MARKISIAKQPAWLKQYASSKQGRRWANRVWNLLMGRLGTRVLMAPTHYAGDASRDVESRRLRELRKLGVHVPSILGHGPGTLLLSDLGPSLSSELKLRKSPKDRDVLIHKAMAALADLHQRGGYLGQAFPRNMSIEDGRIGFMDFEEDPLNILSLPETLARDWVFFTYGVSHYYIDRVDALVHILKQYHGVIDEEARQLIAATARRLSFLDATWTRAVAGGAAVTVSVRVLRSVFGA